MVPGNSGFHIRKNFSKNYPQIGHLLSKRFARSVLCQKSV